MARNIFHNFSILASTILLSSISSLSYAVESILLEEVIVTAQKREQNLQDVGVSVTVMSGDQMSALGFTNTIDIAAQTPNLTYQQFHPTLTNINLRGVSQNDFQDQHEPPVASYIDGAYVSSMGAVHTQMYDLERVEVLRGPQGTLFGRNATGGLLHYISRKPEEETSGYVELTVAENNQTQFEAALGGALTDTVMGRIAIASNSHDGWMENRIGTDLNDADSRSFRGQLLFALSEGVELLIKGHHSKDDSSGYGYNHTPSTPGADGLGLMVGANELATFFQFDRTPFATCKGCDALWHAETDNDPRKGSFDETGKFEREINGLTATLSWDIESMTLTSITDYLSMDKTFRGDTDGSPNSVVVAFLDQGLEQLSQELRLQGEIDRMHWQTGVYYLDIDTDVINAVEPFNIAPFVGVNPPGGFFIPLVTASDSKVLTESWAIFGHLEFKLNEQLTLITALRYTEDEKEVDFDLVEFGMIADNYRNTQKWENVSAKVQLDWQVNDDTLVYAGITRGHKAGSFSLPFLGPVDKTVIPHDEEELTSIEVGYKAIYLNGSARLNMSAFFYDYQDYQAAFFNNFAQIIGNLDAEVYGAELELVLNPVEGLELMLGVSLLDTEVQDVGMPDGSIQDRELPQAADYTLNGLARYTWSLNGGLLTLQVDANYVDDFCFTVVCNHTEEEDSYVVTNARLTYTSGGEHWSIAAFVRNLTDEDYSVWRLDASFAGFSNNMMNPPRWFGATLNYNW